MSAVPDAVEQFRDAIRAAGLVPPDTIEADGELHRFASNGKRGDLAGWYTLHGDGIPAGSFGCWRLGLSESWCANIGRSPRTTSANSNARALRPCGASVRRRKPNATRKPATVPRANGRRRHPPMLRIRTWRARAYRLMGCAWMVTGACWFRCGRRRASLATVHQRRRGKEIPAGRADRGRLLRIGKGREAVCIAEGFATAATIHEATGDPVAVAFNCGNLEAVARAVRGRFPTAKVILCADDDARTEGNPGLTKATGAGALSADYRLSPTSARIGPSLRPTLTTWQRIAEPIP